MPFKAILFDLDGTLLDTLEDLGNSMNRVLQRNKFPTHQVSAYRNFVGEGITMLVKRALPREKLDSDTIRACIQAFQEDYARNWNVKTKPYEGISETLDTLLERNMKLAILSNKPDYFTKACVSEFLPSWPFEIVLGQQDSIPLKPDPAGAIKIAEHLKIARENILYLGDTAIDMQTAVSAGMYPVGALWGFRTEKELTDSGARILIKRPEEIITSILH
ncbi:MAG: HAD family hydrolase [Candidatus Brocadiaceae bacterium]|nr:HAD family hydrolase [Candidatus Brocadiaceae bacterium]